MTTLNPAMIMAAALAMTLLPWAATATRSAMEKRAVMRALYQLGDLAEVQVDVQSPKDDLLNQLNEIEAQVQADCQAQDQQYLDLIQAATTNQTQLRDQIGQIQDRIDQLVQQRDTTRDQIVADTQLQQQLQAQIVQAQGQVAQAQNDLAQCVSTFNDVNKKLSDLIGTDAKAISALNDLVDLIKKPGSDFDSTATQVIQLLSPSTNDDIKKGVVKLQNDLAKYRVQGQNERIDTKTRLLNTARQLVKDVQKDLGAVQADLTAATTKFANDQKKLQSQVDAGLGLISSLKKKTEAVVAELAHDQSLLGEIAAALSDQQGRLTAVKGEVDQVTEYIDMVQAEQQDEQGLCRQYHHQIAAIRKYLQMHPPNALQSACKPGDQDCPLCLYDKNCPEGLQCSKFALCYNSSLSHFA